MSGNHRRIFFLAAKAAAGFSLNHANLFFRQTKQLNQSLVHVVRTLHRTPHSHAIRSVRNRNRAIVFNVKLLLCARVIFTFDYEVRLRPHVVHVAFINQKLFEDIVFAPDDFLLFQRVFQRKDRRQFFVFDAHIAPRFFEPVLVLMSEQNDWLFGMIHKVVGKIRLVVEDQRNIVLAGNVFRGNDRELIPRNLAFEGNVFDAAPGNRTAHGDAAKHSGKT